MRYGRIGYGIDLMRRSACLVVVDPAAVGGFAFLFGCAPVGHASDSIVGPAWDLLVCLGWLGLDFVLCVA